MRRVLSILAVMAVPASSLHAESGGSFLDELSIEGVGYSGRAAIAQFYGRSLVVEEGRWKGVLLFKAGGRMTWTKPSGETLHGHFGDDAAHPSMCIDVSFDDSACYDVQQAGNDLKFSGKDLDAFTAHAEPGEADAPLPEPDEAFCEPLAKILEAGRAGHFDSLIDKDKESFRINDFADESFWTTTQFSEDSCRFQENYGHPIVVCDFFFRDDAPEAEDLFEMSVGLAQSCSPRDVEKADIDMQTWLRYSEIDFATMTSRKKASYEPAKDETKRRATIRYAGKVELELELGYRSICTTVLDCKYHWGTWLRFEKRK